MCLLVITFKAEDKVFTNFKSIKTEFILHKKNLLYCLHLNNFFSFITLIHLFNFIVFLKPKNSIKYCFITNFLPKDHLFFLKK